MNQPPGIQIHLSIAGSMLKEEQDGQRALPVVLHHSTQLVAGKDMLKVVA
jgi:hypothetical protein